MNMYLTLLALFLIPTISYSDPNLYFLGDIEGNPAHLETLVREGVIKIQDGRIKLLTGSVVSVGDLLRRGDRGIETVHLIRTGITETMNLGADDFKVFGNIGNHDVNGLSFVLFSYAIDQNLIADYDKWANEKKYEEASKRLLSSRLWWWTEKMGLSDKVYNFWLELAENKSNRPRSEFLGPDNKLDTAKLTRIVSQAELAQQFLDYYSPGGDGFEVLKVLAPIMQFKDGKIITLHSGQPTRSNLGRIYGQAGYALEDLTNPRAMSNWVAAYKSFNAEHLNAIETLLREYKTLDQRQKQLNAEMLATGASFSTEKLAELKSANDKKTELATRMRDNHYIIWGDAGWDYTKGALALAPDSPIYPDKGVYSQSSLPGVPEGAVLNHLVMSGVELVIGGHIPVGDGPVARVGIDPITRKRVLFLTVDTSYSAKEGLEVTKVTDFGVEVKAETRYGDRYRVDYLFEEERNKLRLSSHPADRDRLEAMERYGYAVDGGYIISGNLTKIVDGQEVIDYENFLLIKQEGYNFSYKKTSKYGIEESIKNGTYEIPNSDLKTLRVNAKLKQAATLKALGKNDLTMKQYNEMIANKHLWLLSGPSLASLDPVRDTNPKALKEFYENFRNDLRQVELDKEVVFLGGGSKGLETEMVVIILEENARRISQGGKAFEMIGHITGVTPDREIDPNMKNYLRLDAYYWDDYLEEVYKTLIKAAKNGYRPKSFQADFAGGGGILPNQILRDTLAMLAKLRRITTESKVQVRLNEKLNKLNADGTPVLSGTDKSIAKLKSGEAFFDIKNNA